MTVGIFALVLAVMALAIAIGSRGLSARTSLLVSSLSRRLDDLDEARNSRAEALQLARADHVRASLAVSEMIMDKANDLAALQCPTSPELDQYLADLAHYARTSDALLQTAALREGLSDRVLRISGHRSSLVFAFEEVIRSEVLRRSLRSTELQPLGHSAEVRTILRSLRKAQEELRAVVEAEMELS